MKAGAALHVRVQQQGPIPLEAILRCAQGEVLALVGPSGSGKSTLLRCIAGLYRPGQGKVLCFGQTWLDTRLGVDIPPQRRRVGLLFQDYALFPHLSALDNVRLALGHLPGIERPYRAMELLERVHLQGLESRRPGALSGGQQQRVALARALAREPEVLLLDEPFSAVDQVTRRKLRLEMAELTRNLRIPVILVTHDLDEACMLGDRLVVLHNGKTLQDDSPQAVLRRPASATVARLIDVRNLFEAQVSGHAPDQDTTLLDWQGIRLEVGYAPRFPVGRKVCWSIQPADVLLHRRVQPSRGVKENPVQARVLKLVTIGGLSNVIMAVHARPETRLHMDLPPHVVRRNGIREGDDIGVSLLKRAIHLMPWQRLRPAD
jgi:molybdate transport system ATP-binding protein